MILFKSTHERRIKALQEAHKAHVESLTDEIDQAYKRGIIESQKFAAENNCVIYNKSTGIAASAKFGVDPGDVASIRDAMSQVQREYEQ